MKLRFLSASFARRQCDQLAGSTLTDVSPEPIRGRSVAAARPRSTMRSPASRIFAIRHSPFAIRHSPFGTGNGCVSPTVTRTGTRFGRVRTGLRTQAWVVDRVQRAAIDRVVHQQLGDRRARVTEGRLRQENSRLAVGSRRRRLEGHVQFDVYATARAHVSIVEVGPRLRIGRFAVASGTIVANASSVTIHGGIVVMKFVDRNVPSG